MIERKNKVRACENILAGLLGRKDCVLTGNGTSALRIAYSLAAAERPKVLLPAMICLNPMLAVHYAGRIPLFTDVLKEDATIDPEAVSGILKKDSRIGAVLAVHLYGHPADMKRLSEVCADNNVMLIEDLAQAMGGVYPDGKLLGSAGHCSVVSFGYSKILDAGGGGALLIDDDALAKKARLIAAGLSNRSPQSSLTEKIYKKLFYAFWGRGQKNTRAYDLFDLFPSLFQEMHIYKTTDNQAVKIMVSLKDLEKEVLDRRQIYEVYRNELSGIPDILFFSPQRGYSPWRFTFRVAKERRTGMINHVRRRGFDISSWYPCINRWTPSGREGAQVPLKSAGLLEKEVVNLWVSREYNKKRAFSLAKVIKKNLS